MTMPFYSLESGYSLETAEIARQGTDEELRHDAPVKEAYLGG